MRYWIGLIIACLGLEVLAMDIAKVYKVTLEPKKPYYRKMDQAIYVQMPSHSAHRFLHKIGHQCCKDVPRE